MRIPRETNGTFTVVTMAVAGILAAATTASADPQYCTPFNNHYLTRILTDQDDCGSYPCGFYSHDFGDAVETCGDELFKVNRPDAARMVTCDFCYWSSCWTVRKNTFGVTALDEINAPPWSPLFRELALNAPSTQVIFRGGHGEVVDSPPTVFRAILDSNRNYVYWLVADHSLAEARTDVAVPVFFSLTAANQDGFNHLISLTSQQNAGATAFAWEDLKEGGDNDINDVVFTTSCTFQMRPAPPPARWVPQSVRFPLTPRNPEVPREPGSVAVDTTGPTAP